MPHFIRHRVDVEVLALLDQIAELLAEVKVRVCEEEADRGEDEDRANN